MPEIAAADVMVSGLLRGRDLGGPARLVAAGDAVRLERGPGGLAIPLGAIDGVAARGSVLDLHLASADVLQAHGDPDALASVEHAIVHAICVLPELTRSLRVFGTAAGGHAPEHDRFFEPLLAARRRAVQAPSAEAAVAAFDAGGLRMALERTAEAVAAERYPGSAPDRRALRAELLECSGALLYSLDGLAAAQRALALDDAATRFVRWRAWENALRGAFEKADQCWGATRDTIEMAVPIRQESGWKRWLGRRGGP